MYKHGLPFLIRRRVLRGPQLLLALFLSFLVAVVGWFYFCHVFCEAKSRRGESFRPPPRDKRFFPRSLCTVSANQNAPGLTKRSGVSGRRDAANLLLSGGAGLVRQKGEFASLLQKATRQDSGAAQGGGSMEDEVG